MGVGRAEVEVDLHPLRGHGRQASATPVHGIGWPDYSIKIDSREESTMKTSRIAAVLCAVALSLVFVSQALATKYVALGDSYSSGTGTRTFYEASCQRSVYAYPYLLHE